MRISFIKRNLWIIALATFLVGSVGGFDCCLWGSCDCCEVKGEISQNDHPGAQAKMSCCETEAPSAPSAPPFPLGEVISGSGVCECEDAVAEPWTIAQSVSFNPAATQPSDFFYAYSNVANDIILGSTRIIRPPPDGYRNTTLHISIPTTVMLN